LTRYMLGQPLDFKPGTKTAYSNFGYMLLGMIIERVTGQPYADYVRGNTLAPMGITAMVNGAGLDSYLPNQARRYGPNDWWVRPAWGPRAVTLPPGGVAGLGARPGPVPARHRRQPPPAAAHAGDVRAHAVGTAAADRAALERQPSRHGLGRRAADTGRGSVLE